jgi:hypothetical protein
MFFTTNWFQFQYYIKSFEYSSKLSTLAVLSPFFIISEEEGYLIGFVEFDMQLFCQNNCMEPRIKTKHTAPPSNCLCVKNMKHKKLIEIPLHLALSFLSIQH